MGAWRLGGAKARSGAGLSQVLVQRPAKPTVESTEGGAIVEMVEATPGD